MKGSHHDCLYLPKTFDMVYLRESQGLSSFPILLICQRRHMKGSHRSRTREVCCCSAAEGVPRSAQKHGLQAEIPNAV